MTEDQIKMENWVYRISIVEKFVNSFTFPVFTSKDGKNFELFGSSVGISIKGDNYFCTTEHLIKSVLSQENNCLIAANGRFEELDLDSVHYIKQPSVDVDLCLVRPKNKCDHISFLSDLKLTTWNDRDRTSWQYLQGYPLSGNKYYNLHDHQKAQIRTGYINTAVRVDQTIKPTIEGVSSDSHLLFSYKETVFKDMDKSDVESRKRQNRLSLRGCSGCGLWNISKETENPEIELAGIFTSFKSDVGIASKSRYLTF